MKRVVKFFLDSSLELEELDSPPLVHSQTAIVAVDVKSAPHAKNTASRPKLA
jgi:hypothetical protein